MQPPPPTVAGSFFDLKPSGGSFAANPPFVDCLMDATAVHVLALLEAQGVAGPSALSFVVVLPGWSETAAYTTLSASPFLRRRVLVAAADHGYCDGASHHRQDPFRESPYDTALFVLQTDRAARKWPATDEVEAELRAALAACVPSASALKRQPGSNAPPGQKRARGAAEAAEAAESSAQRQKRGADGKAASKDAGRVRMAGAMDGAGRAPGEAYGEGGGDDGEEYEAPFSQLLASGEGAPRNPKLDASRPNRLPGQASAAKGKDGVYKEKAAREQFGTHAPKPGKGGGGGGDEGGGKGGGKGGKGSKGSKGGGKGGKGGGKGDKGKGGKGKGGKGKGKGKGK